MLTCKELSPPFIYEYEDRYVVVRRVIKTGQLIGISPHYKNLCKAKSYLKGWQEAQAINTNSTIVKEHG